MLDTTIRAINLKALLGDTTPETFEREIRDRKRLHVPGALTTDETRRLFSIERFDALATSGALAYPDIEVVEDGKPISPPVDANKRPHHGALAARLAKGATVRMRAIDALDPQVNAANIALGDDHDAIMEVNAFLTPRNAAGFAPHYDQRDIWVVQTHGSKIWRIFEQGTRGRDDMPLPLSGQGFNPKTMTVGEQIDEITLREGDALYLPRGTGHAASCTDEPSLHLTFSMIIDTVGDVLVDYVRKLHLARLPLRERVGHAELSNATWLANRLAGAGVLQDIDQNVLAQVAAERMRTFSARAVSSGIGGLTAVLQAPSGTADVYDHVPETIWRTTEDARGGETLHIGRSSYAMGASEMGMVRAIVETGVADRAKLKETYPDVSVDGMLDELENVGMIRRR